MVRKDPSPQVECVRVTFEIPASFWADKVYLVGDFNNWEHGVSPFRRMYNGIWRIPLDLPAWRRFEFRYLVDGRWCTDYHADGHTEGIDHGINSFVFTALSLESLATFSDHGMVRESAFETGMDFATKRHQ